MNLARRLWAYQAERFPLLRTVPLLAVFSAAAVNVSAVLAGRSLPGPGAYATAFVLAFVLFFQMRAADEVKDAEDDRRFRPERPIPRGLVSLRLIVGLAAAAVPPAVAAAWAWHPPLLWLLALAWAWLALMTAEFLAPAWLKARPILYLVSHMAILPLIDLLLTAVEWLPGGGPDPALALFLALSFVNGCVLEIGRKLKAPGNERPGVETYSALWGPARAARIWTFCVAAAAALVALNGLALGIPGPAALAAGLGLAAAALPARRYASAPTPAAETALDAASGLWVLLAYATLGFLPLAAGGAP
ncbi:MAG: UbiA family prenyltransferase [Rhodobacteraceae bacterium]|nr:UbiA family prenyltransferase [Paracoccaceae bacterium]